MENLLRREDKKKIQHEYGHHALYRLLYGAAKEYECRMPVLRLSPEAVFAEVVCLLDIIRRDADGAEEYCDKLWEELYCNYRDICDKDIPEDELLLAVTIVMLITSTCLCAIKASSCHRLSMRLMRGVCSHYPLHWREVLHRLEDDMMMPGDIEDWANAYMDGEEYMSGDDGVLCILHDGMDTLPHCLDEIGNQTAGHNSATYLIHMSVGNLKNEGTINDIHDNRMVDMAALSSSNNQQTKNSGK